MISRVVIVCLFITFSLFAPASQAAIPEAGGAAEIAEAVIAEITTADSSDSNILRIAFLLSVVAFLPAAFISMTSFVRIVIVLAMVRHAFGMPETPPNQVLLALGLFLTVFSMGPTFGALNNSALQPLLSGEATIEEGVAAARDPMRDFMLSKIRDEDLATIYSITGTPLPETVEEVDFFKLVPAFILNELRVSFTIGFIILLPFLLIDLIVASILLSLGMMMVPPITISLPIKVLMFVLIDGWALIIEGLLGGLL